MIDGAALGAINSTFSVLRVDGQGSKVRASQLWQEGGPSCRLPQSFPLEPSTSLNMDLTRLKLELFHHSGPFYQSERHLIGAGPLW